MDRRTTEAKLVGRVDAKARASLMEVALSNACVVILVDDGSARGAMFEAHPLGDVSHVVERWEQLEGEGGDRPVTRLVASCELTAE